MIFTSRTYRHAIRRSINEERLLIEVHKTFVNTPFSRVIKMELHQQINHTRRLQARKRKERK